MRDLLHLKQSDSDPPNSTAFLQITKPDEFWSWAKTDLVKGMRRRFLLMEGRPKDERWYEGIRSVLPLEFFCDPVTPDDS